VLGQGGVQLRPAEQILSHARRESGPVGRPAEGLLQEARNLGRAD
jgi:hypothetical protein